MIMIMIVIVIVLMIKGNNYEDVKKMKMKEI